MLTKDEIEIIKGDYWAIYPDGVELVFDQAILAIELQAKNAELKAEIEQLKGKE